MCDNVSKTSSVISGQLRPSSDSIDSTESSGSFDAGGKTLTVKRANVPKNFFGDELPSNLDKIRQKRHPEPERRLAGRVKPGVSAGTKAKAVGGALLMAGAGAAIGAAVGSVIPLAGTIVGAIVGGASGGVLGSIGAGAKLAGESEDLLDTTRGNRGLARRVQRNARWSWARALTPGRLARGVAQLLPLSGHSYNPISMAATGVAGVGRGKIHPVEVPISDPGRSGTRQDARDNLRYAVAMQMGYSNFSTPKAMELRNPTQLIYRYNKDAAKKLPETAHIQEIFGADGPHPKEDAPVWDYVNLVPPRSSPLNYQPNEKEAKAYAIFEGLPENLKASLQENFGRFKDPHTGNHMRLLYDAANNEVVIAHSGSADPFGRRDEMGATQWRGNLANYSGGVPPSVKQSIAVGKAVRDAVAQHNEDSKHHPDFKPIGVTSVGHSRGGLMAQAEALANGGRAVCANSEPLGVGVRQHVGMLYSQDKPVGTEIVQLSTRGDFITDAEHSAVAKTGKGAAALAESIGGWGVPANAGSFVRFQGDPDHAAHPEFFHQLAFSAARPADVVQPHEDYYLDRSTGQIAPGALARNDEDD